jgi:riboflavin transporter FmnP
VNTKTVAGVVIFTALAIVLNLSPIKVPAPYAPFLIYQVWEIPIVAAFLLYGTVAVVLITVINTTLLLAVYPGALPTGPLYNLAAILSMILGIGLAKMLIAKYSPKNDATVATLYTASGVVLRTAFMAFINYMLLRYPPPVGYGLPEEAVVASIPLIVVFNATLALYTVPVGYSLAKIVLSNVKAFK